MFAVVSVSSTPAQARNYNKKSSSNNNPKYASLIMDADSGRILSQRHSNKVLHPASLTKMMTMLLVFEALDRKEIRKDTRIRISKHAASMVPSKLGLKPGSSIKVEHAIKVLAAKSANDIAVAVAEHLAGSEKRFANGMTTRARHIGMKSTRFKNASGLHDPSQVSTARDMALLARYILKRYPHHYKYFSTRTFTYQGKTYKNHNKLLGTYQGMDGFKTGYINASGYNLVASANRGGQRLIGVVFGGRSGKTRNDHMAVLMDAGFKKMGSSYNATYIEKKSVPIPAQKPTYGVAQKKTEPKFAVITSTNKPVRQQQTKSQDTSYASLSALDNKIDSPKIIKPKVIEQGSTNDYAEDPIHLKNSLVHPKDIVGKWAVQIGAYKSRVRTDNALRKAKSRLPKHLQIASPMSVPLNTSQGVVFRARLGGLNEEQARQVCQIFDDCIAVAPIATKVSSR